MIYKKDDLKHFKMLDKEDRIKLIHFRITKEQNRLRSEKAKEKLALKIERKRIAKEERKKVLMERYGTLTPTAAQVFIYVYGDKIKECIPSETVFLSRMTKDRWRGGKISIGEFNDDNE